MAQITGREVTIGLKKAAAWGTPTAAGANDGVLLLGNALPAPQYEILRDHAMGLAWASDRHRGLKNMPGPLRANLRYDGLTTLLAMAMGTAGVPTAQTGGGATLAFLHALRLADSLDTRFVTVAQKKMTDRVWEWPSVKVHGFTLRWSKRSYVEITFQAIANSMNRNGGTGTNNTTTIATVTYRTKQHLLFADQASYVRINDKSAGALGSGDAITPSEVILTYLRPMSPEHVLDATDYTVEPTQDGEPECMLELGFPRSENLIDTTFLTNLEADTLKKIAVFFEGALTDGTEKRRMTINMPAAHLQGDPEAITEGLGRQPARIRFLLTETDTAPTGMTGFTKPFGIDLVNTQSTDPLA